MELSKPRQGNKHIPLGCRFGVFFFPRISFPASFALTTPKHSTLRPMVPHTHPTNMEDPPPQTTHSRQMPAPPMGRSKDRSCQGRSRRNRGMFKGCRRRYRARRRNGYGGRGRDRTAAVASTRTATATTAAAAINLYSVVLTSFARHDLNAYIQPYWVRCLRVVWRRKRDGRASGQGHQIPTTPYIPVLGIRCRVHLIL